MAYEATMARYRKEFVAAFEQDVSLLKMVATKESMTDGLTATFLISGSNGDTATTRGSNGQIPYSNPTNTQVTATLAEKHAGYELTGFNIFVSQGDQTRIMQMASMNVINRDIDLTILSGLASATQNFGTGTASVGTVAGCLAILGNSQVRTWEADNMFGIVSPAFMAYLMQTTEFASSDYVEVKPYAGPTRRMLRWFGINWIVNPLVTGVGTASEICYIMHKNALGYAVRVQEEKISIGYDEKQDTSWSRATTFHAAKLLQNTGIVKITHDGSAFVAS